MRALTGCPVVLVGMGADTVTLDVALVQGPYQRPERRPSRPPAPQPIAHLSRHIAVLGT